MILILEVPFNSSLMPVILGARKLASFGSDYAERIVSFDFNGVIVSVKWDSEPELLRRDFSRPSCGIAYGKVGPYPNLVLTDEERESDARVSAEIQRVQAEERAEEEARLARAEARLSVAPEMEFSDKDAWEQAVREFGIGSDTSIPAYAERYARLVQLEISRGKAFEDVWQQASHDADFGDMSGYTHGLAIHILTDCWVHGLKLRRVHNARWGVVSAEGTVNPAVLISRVG